MRLRIACYDSLRRVPKPLFISLGILCSASLIFTEKVHAQEVKNSPDPNIVITGKVTDENGKPLQGVTVQVKGRSNATVTNPNGDYRLPVNSKNASLLFSFVGMDPQEISVGSKLEINATLMAASVQQQEVVVIGYGTQKKQAVTGAVAVANLKAYGNVSVNNILESVKGAVPGLNVGGISTAGELATISVRGQNSINAGTSPLIVVDGAIFRGTLNDIAPADIESLTVLKDASAAAVYGSRSANGVILIETKKGSGINK